MGYWLVRMDAPSVEISDDGASFTLWSRGEPRISVSDQVVFLEGAKSAVFKRTGRVADVQKLEELSEQESGVLLGQEKRATKIALEDLKELPSSLELDDMRYSLTFVRNTRSPWLHFRRGYRVLPKDDFETLKAGQPFVARTGYYEFFNALPGELQVEFRAEMTLDPPPGGGDKFYIRRLERLLSFIDQRVIKAAELLVEIQKIATQLDLRDQEGQRCEHVFADEAVDHTNRTYKFDELEEQNRRIAGLRRELARPLAENQFLEQRNVVQLILDTINQPERQQAEARFERLFKSRV